MFDNEVFKDLITKNFFDGTATMSDEDNQNAASLIASEFYQKEFCKYIVHTGEHLILFLY